ncbi:MAG TPA: hypothetical protein DIU15_09880, partial [Deltaproteobacteria bacterium]|nr:hypothetical protein [Deltaproteobacteria bacterium]
EAGLRATSRDGLPGGVARPDQLVPGNSRLTPAEQLQIYAFMYFARLVEVLQMEYPTVRFLVGPEQFEQLARGFLVAHPSSHYSLNRLSVAFPAYLRDEATEFEHRTFAVALAEVERAMEDVTDEQRDEPLASEALTEIPHDRWAGARFRPIRAMRLLELSHPTSQFMNAVQQDRHASVPSPEPTVVCVYRPNNIVFRKPISALRYRLLTRLIDGQSLGEAVEAIVMNDSIDPAFLAGSLQEWFRDWAEDQVFAAIEFDGP